MVPIYAPSEELKALRCGVFDLDRGPQLGGLLIHINELLALDHDAQPRELELLAFGSQVRSPIIFESGKLISNNITQVEATVRLLSAVSEIAKLRRVRAFPSLDALTKGITADNPLPEFYPSLDKVRSGTVEYGSTLSLQTMFMRSGSLPHLSMRRERLMSAQGWLEMHIFPAVPVIVHLKNTGAGPLQSDADFSEWWSFFEQAAQTHPEVRFVLIGDDPIPAEYLLRDNTLRPPRSMWSLAQDLALIQLGHSFLGMSSGPCQMALLSNVPYVIYKSPHQHVAHIEQEIGSSDRFLFAVDSQYFLRVKDSCKTLYRNFLRLWTEHSLGNWKERVARLVEEV